ncbi:MAG TPA: maleylpyruvate isomerase N-terminal domain-containing protein [Actinomycetota bacterium]|nr:maleylpyruvate isomerase N-terminal domain-containing protein [Actinomycetota bacterium]
MATLTVDRTRTREAVQEVTDALVGLVGSVPDTGVRMPDHDWTVGDAASHLIIAARLFGELVQGVPTFYAESNRESLAAANAHSLSTRTERDGRVLAADLAESMGALLAGMAARPPTQRMLTPMGDMDQDMLLSYTLTHLLMHGHAMARALRKPSPVTRERVSLTLPFIAGAMRTVLAPERVGRLTATYLIHLRGGPKLAVSFTGGAIDVATTAPTHVDCHLSADPVAFFLVGVGLVSQWGQIARFKMLAWGTKPWLGLRLVGFFSPP